MKGNTTDDIRPQRNNQTCEHHPKHPFAPDLRRIGFYKFFTKQLRLAHTPPREPERFFVVQTALLESGDGIAQVRFQFAPDFRRETSLPGQFLPPAFNRGVQIVTGLIFHNLPRVL